MFCSWFFKATDEVSDGGLFFVFFCFRCSQNLRVGFFPILFLSLIHCFSQLAAGTAAQGDMAAN